MYPSEAQELAYAWSLVGYPLDSIADMHIKLQYKMEQEKEHTVFLEKLVEALYGDGWQELTIYTAKEWRRNKCLS